MKDKKLSSLKAQRTKLLKSEVRTNEEFEEVQDKLNKVEVNLLYEFLKEGEKDVI